MGTRINYFIASDIKAERLTAIIYSNDSHPTYNAEQHFQELAKSSIGPNELIWNLLHETYPSPNPDDEHPFLLADEALDNEKVYFVYWQHSEKLARKGYMKPLQTQIKELPALTEPNMSAILAAMGDNRLSDVQQEQFDNSINAMAQDDACGTVFVFKRENSQLRAIEIKDIHVLAELSKDELAQYEMILLDGGNSSGDSWKHVLFPQAGKSIFVREDI